MKSKNQMKKAKRIVAKTPKKTVPSGVKSAPKLAKNAFKVTPLADRVVVRPLADEASLRPSGIYIPETADKERPQEGTVVAVGPGAYDDGVLVPMSVKIGDRVMFSKYGYDEMKIDGVEYFVVKEENILAIIK